MILQSSHLILEGEIEGLLGKITNDTGKVASPEAPDSFVLERGHHAIPDASKATVKFALQRKQCNENQVSLVQGPDLYLFD